MSNHNNSSTELVEAMAGGNQTDTSNLLSTTNRKDQKGPTFLDMSQTPT